MKVKPNLYLNMSPQTTEEGGLAFARNMKLDDDGNLISDYGYENIASMADYDIVGHIVGLDNKIYFFTSDNKIIEYDEITKTKEELSTNWTYNDGEIDGCVTTNQSGEKILTIAEYKEGVDIPLKHINLSFPNIGDESFYCQAPKCPTANLILTGTYVKTIPNGVYVFFIRYKIRKDVYTNWFLCSRPIFGGTSEKITTLQGGLSYINLHKDSAKSFVFQLDFAAKTDINYYEEFQLGFIITHDEATDARTWKHFNTNSFAYGSGNIYFDYEEVEEANIDEFLETTYELYNVRNVCSFKNKLYISNYKENDFNPDLQELASHINLVEVHSQGDDIKYKNLKIHDIELNYNQSLGYYDTTINGDSILSILNKDFFNFTVSKLAKIKTKEKQSVVKFDIIWKDSIDPDIAMVYNIYNYLYESQVFGPNYADPYQFSIVQNQNWIDEGLGVKFANYDAGDGGLWVYKSAEKPHPWYNLGLTFGFGSYSDNDKNRDYARQGCFYFNKYTDNRYSIDGIFGWYTRDKGFTNAARVVMINKLKEDIANKSFSGKAYVEITSGAKTYTIGYSDRMDFDNYAGYDFDDYDQEIHIHDITHLDSDLLSTETLSSSFKEIIEKYAYYAVFNSSIFQGVDENGTPIVLINGDKIRVNSVSVRFKKFEFSLEVDDIEDIESNIYKSCRVNLTTTDYASICTFAIKDSKIKVSDIIRNITQSPTLMPLSTYQPYVHFVDEHNIVTNGIPLQEITVGSALSDTDVISFDYSISDLPTNKYRSFFISLVNVGDIIIEGFDLTKDPNTGINILHCIELDSMLYNINDNITIRARIMTPRGDRFEDITTEAKYYPSGTSYPPLAFGNCGYVGWTGTIPDLSDRFYIVISRNKSNENINNLVKASAYLPLVNTVDQPLKDGYYGSWLCLVKKPSFLLSSSCYVSGKDVYNIDRTAGLSLTEFKNYIQVQDSVTYFVRSNFNLNYLSLTEDINDTIFSVGSASAGIKQAAKVINSIVLSSIYELKSMYRDFSNKYFRRKEDDYKIQFDNTIRVSNVLSDETFNNSVFKFVSTDYYNIPTDRGIIVNLFAIGNNIFVHCKGSLYKFDGNATIAANDKDIQLQSTEPFDAGISQIIDSEYGYGGIDTKQAGCITFDSYFFYDQASNHIFAYGGNSQIQLIDGNIYKLLAHYRPSECKTLHDEANCRVLFEFTSGRDEYKPEEVQYKTFTISYNYKTKTFVSFHDISLTNAFASRHKAYSYRPTLTYKSTLIRLFDTDSAINPSPLVEEMNVNQIFGGATTACIIEFGSQIYKKQASPFGIAVVLFPQSNLKETVDSVKYVADIQQLDTETQSTPIYDVLVNPQVTRNNPVTNFYIITDSCVSNLVTTNVDDTARPDIGHEDQKDDKYYRKHNTRTTPMTPSTLMDYKGFKYDMGFWTSNYFRNKLNEADIYNYGDTVSRALGMDRNSLVYGRYFILVFDFKSDTPIKFEDVYMNTDKY